MRFVLPHGQDRMDNDEVGAGLWMRWVVLCGWYGIGD